MAMTDFDPEKLVAAMRKIVQKVEFLEEENGKLRRIQDELAIHLANARKESARQDKLLSTGLDQIAEGLQKLLDTCTDDLKVQNQSLRKDITVLQALAAEHERALHALGKSPRLIKLDEAEPEPQVEPQLENPPLLGSEELRSQ
jgi:hypothetical protein